MYPAVGPDGVGTDWALREWVSWVLADGADYVQTRTELAEEWQSFAYGYHDAEPVAALYEMVRLDNDTETTQQFLRELRLLDHQGRGAASDVLFSIMGSATHHDLAQFLRHELCSVAVCTSISNHGIWYVYHRDRHRWSFDPEGTDVLVWSLRILSEQLDNLRAKLADVSPGDARAQAKTVPRVAFPIMANFPGDDEASYVSYQRAMLVHLDTIIGDVRHMQSVVRYLGKLMMQRTFSEQLDVKNEHLVPFCNGVLDLERLELRDGHPGDLVMRGPSYAWADFPSSDADTEEMERMLSQIFTDREVLHFFLEMGGTWLRRRNRFKHFYVFTSCGPLSWRAHSRQGTPTAERVC
jgi:hypothetical protein